MSLSTANLPQSAVPVAAPPAQPVMTFQETASGLWRRCVYPDGRVFKEFRSHATLFGLPVVHFTRGVSPETGRCITAKGIIAIGRKACGVVAIGQAAWGLVAFGQLAVGILFGFGQAATGVVCVGQAAISIVFALGQFAVGDVAIGQFAYGSYVLAQIGFGQHVWDTRQADPIARQFFGRFF